MSTLWSLPKTQAKGRKKTKDRKTCFSNDLDPLATVFDAIIYLYNSFEWKHKS